jgi:hypothetical protein
VAVDIDIQQGPVLTDSNRDLRRAVHAATIRRIGSDVQRYSSRPETSGERQRWRMRALPRRYSAKSAAVMPSG